MSAPYLRQLPGNLITVPFDRKSARVKIRNLRPTPEILRARNDPSEFITQCLTDPEGKPIVQSKIHRELQNFLTDNRMSLIELPRDHGKTMQICGRVLWELGNKPHLRIKIVCSSEGVAAERGRFLQQAIVGNKQVQRIFPGLCSDQPWTATRFGVQRPANMIGPSVTSIGVGASLTGTRADLLVCDDIVDIKSLASRAERQRIKNYFRDNLMNLLEPGGRCWCLFTPWHNDDLNNELKKNGAFQHFRRAISENLEPIWPERWPRQRLQERKNEIGSTSFARGYRLVPLADEDVPIRTEWIRFWDTERPCERIILSIDPAVSAKAKADASALVVLGKIGNEIRCLESTARRVAAPELVQLIDQTDRRWQPDAILFESNAAFAGIKDLLIRHAGFGPKIKGIVQTKEKAARVAAFSVLVENASFRLHGACGLAENGVDPGQRDLFEEMIGFPAGEHDDLLDAAATGAEYLLQTRELRIW